MAKEKTNRKNPRQPKVEVVDLFCGIGGLSYGMKSAGFDILAGYDLDWTCQYAYETNTGGKFFYKDVKSVTGDEIKKLYSKKKNAIKVGIAPLKTSRKKVKSPNLKPRFLLILSVPVFPLPIFLISVRLNLDMISAQLILPIR